MPSSDGAMTNTEDAIPIFHPSSFDKPAGRYSIGTKVTFDCADYNLVRLNGSRVLECLPEGQWNGTRPSCGNDIAYRPMYNLYKEKIDSAFKE